MWELFMKKLFHNLGVSFDENVLFFWGNDTSGKNGDDCCVDKLKK